MKTCIATAALFICSLTDAFSQSKPCYAYDYAKSEKYIREYLFKGDNFEFFSDSLSAGHDVFNTKNELRRKAIIIPIAVLQFDYQKVAEQGDSLRINSLFTPEYYAFTAFLMNREHLANLIRSSTRGLKSNRKQIDAMGAEPEIAISIYKQYSVNKTCPFFDVTRHRYAYFKDNNYVYYNTEKNSFSTLTAREYVEDHKIYFGIK